MVVDETDNVVDAQAGLEAAEDPRLALREFHTENTPSMTMMFGPGTFRGPIRYLPPGSIIGLWWEYAQLQTKLSRVVASRETFYRIFRSVHGTHLKFRGKTEHAACDTCSHYKRQLRDSTIGPKTREQHLQGYSDHLISQWLDRNASTFLHELSTKCATFLQGGQTLAQLAFASSVLAVDVDGVDQAKFRLPKVSIKTHMFEKLHRPALHVSGVWCHGFCYELGVSDADMYKNTNNNVEVIARALCTCYDVSQQALPQGMVILLDNTWRENRNSKFLKFIIALVSLGVFRWVAVIFFVPGHTHWVLDGTFGQICVRLGYKEFHDDRQCISHLNQILKNIGIDHGSRSKASAYKLDEAANWETWWGQVPLNIEDMCQEGAPHYFRVCRRADLGSLNSHGHDPCAETRSTAQAAYDDPPNGEDLMIVTKDRIASRKIAQVYAVLPQRLRATIVQRQPSETYPRKVMTPAQIDQIVAPALACFTHGDISLEGKNYLQEWAQGTRAREHRPGHPNYGN
jgi:hypothetical protein